MNSSASSVHKINQNILTRWKRVFWIVLCSIGIGLWMISSCSHSQGPADEEKTGSKEVAVVVTHPARKIFEHCVVTQGNIEAKHRGLVSPRIPGTLEHIFVDEGSRVLKGKTPLFETDGVSSHQKVIIEKNALAVEKSSHKQALAKLESAGVNLEKAEMDYHRYQRLHENNNATQDAFEQFRSRYAQFSAAHKVAQAAVDVSAEKVHQAQAKLAIAEKNLSDTRVLAPISGVISQRFKEPGEMGQPGVPVLEVVDTGLLEISAFFPSGIYNAVAVGKTPVHVAVAGVDLGLQHVTQKSPTIDPKLRTFEVKAVLSGNLKDVAAGAMAKAALVLDHREQWGVPEAAVIIRRGSKVVFTIDGDNVAHVRQIETGLVTDGWIEIRSDAISDDWLVVTMGQMQLNEGDTVAIQKGES